MTEKKKEEKRREWYYRNKVHCRPVLLYSEVKDIISALEYRAEKTGELPTITYMKMLRQIELMEGKC